MIICVLMHLFWYKNIKKHEWVRLKKNFFCTWTNLFLKMNKLLKEDTPKKVSDRWEREREKKKIQLLYPVFINTIPEWRKGQRLKTLTKIWPFLIISPIELRRSPSLLEGLSTEGQTRICMKCKIIVLSSTPVNCFLLSLHRVPSDGSPIGH